MERGQRVDAERLNGAFILGRLGALDASGAIAAWVRGTGAILVLAGVGVSPAGWPVPRGTTRCL